MITSNASAPVASADWNFDTIPDRHLIACCYWEYARESAFLRAFKSRCVESNRHPKPFREAFELCGKDARRVLSIGSVANSFLLGFGFEADDPRHPGVARKLDPNQPVSGNFPASWQSLCAGERDYRAELATAPVPGGAAPFERASGCEAANALMLLTSIMLSDMPVAPPWAINDTLERQLEQVNSHAAPAGPKTDGGGPECKAGGVAAVAALKPDQGVLPWPTPSIQRFDTHSRCADEIALVQIQWGSFSDAEMMESFRAWLKANRPEAVGPVPGRGHKLKDWRANLTRLGVMRLVARFSALELLDPKTDLIPGLWESRQFSGPTWLDVVKWHDARRGARALFHELFPFLSPAEEPLSWPTAHQRP